MHKSFVSFVKFIPRDLILSDAIVNGIDFFLVKFIVCIEMYLWLLSINFVACYFTKLPNVPNVSKEFSTVFFRVF